MTALAGRPAHDITTSLAPGSARSLLFTILGEFAWPSGAPIRTATMVSLLGGLGVEEQTARQAIARAGASDWIAAQRRGREVSWTLTTKIREIFQAGSGRVHSMSRPFDDWDGRWLAVLPTIPQSLRSARRPLYAGLRWAGLGDPAPGLWVSPHWERAAEVRELIADLGLVGHTVALIGSVESIGIAEAEVVARGWDLSALAEHYAGVLERVRATRPTDPEQTLLAHIRLLNEWQEFPRTDPQLPEALLPDWIGRTVARRIEAMREQWSPSAHGRYARLNAE